MLELPMKTTAFSFPGPFLGSCDEIGDILGVDCRIFIERLANLGVKPVRGKRSEQDDDTEQEAHDFEHPFHSRGGLRRALSSVWMQQMLTTMSRS